MTTRVGADFIRTSRQIHSFRGIANSTGAPTQVADLGRMVRGESVLFTKMLRRQWMGDRETSHAADIPAKRAPQPDEKVVTK